MSLIISVNKRGFKRSKSCVDSRYKVNALTLIQLFRKT